MAQHTVKQAVQIAKSFVSDVLQDEDPKNIGLEEIERTDDGKTWKITIGFSRRWNGDGSLSYLSELPSMRDYRVVTIDDLTGEPLAMTRRSLLDAHG